MSRFAVGDCPQCGSDDPLFDGDTGELCEEGRSVLTRILAEKAITSRRHGAALWTTLLDHREVIESRLSEMYLRLVLDTDHEVALKRQIRVDGPDYRKLGKDNRYSREATALLLYVREQFYERSRLGDGVVRLRDDDLRAAMRDYIHAEENDRAGRERPMNAAINELERQTILSAAKDRPGEYLVSPVIVHVMTLDEIDRITRSMTEDGADPVEDETPDMPDREERA